MANKKRKTNKTPRRKRMSRKDRLQSGIFWLEKYNGKNVIRGFSNWYGVSNICAILELRLLGVEISDERLNQAKLVEENKARSKAEKKKKKEEKLKEILWEDSDDNFYYIAGYTSGGAPYGTTWDEVDEKSPWDTEEL